MRTVLVLSLAGLAILGCGGSRPAPSAPVSARGGDPAERTAVVPAIPPLQATPPSQKPAKPATPATGSRMFRPPRVPGVIVPIDPRLGDIIVVGGTGREDGDGLPPPWLRAAEALYDKKSDYWSPCVREFVQTEPEAARVALGEALSLYSTSCTSGPARRVEFRTPRVGRGGPEQSHLGLIGALERTTSELALTAAYHGEPVHAERITLIADGMRWSSPRIAFERNDGWEIATLPITRSLVRVVQQAISARETVLRFEGTRAYQDVMVSDEMKQDLRVMLDALDAINRL